MPTLIGPFAQIVTMENLPLHGKITDEQLVVAEAAGVVVHQGKIREVGPFDKLSAQAEAEGWETEGQPEDLVLLPGFIDCHTHICFAGSRAADYALRNQGVSYLEIARQGGGIWHTVSLTREAREEDLLAGLMTRANTLVQQGVTTIEVKSGYGLHIESELKMLEVIRKADAKVEPTLVSTCLAAHMVPRDFQGSAEEYLTLIREQLLPRVLAQKLSHRVDIFVEETAFSPDQAIPYLRAAKAMGFQLTVHADQFSTGGSQVAIQAGALSADHLEASGDREIDALARSEVVAVALPGASLGLGMPFTPARKILDRGGALAIASDWNPGSAPMGHLLTQASILGAYEKLSTAEVLAGITLRAAAALGLRDRGRLTPGYRADLIAFPGRDFREILYRQGQLMPAKVWVEGKKMP